MKGIRLRFRLLCIIGCWAGYGLWAAENPAPVHLQTLEMKDGSLFRGEIISEKGGVVMLHVREARVPRAVREDAQFKTRYESVAFNLPAKSAKDFFYFTSGNFDFFARNATLNKDEIAARHEKNVAFVYIKDKAKKSDFALNDQGFSLLSQTGTEVTFFDLGSEAATTKPGTRTVRFDETLESVYTLDSSFEREVVYGKGMVAPSGSTGKSGWRSRFRPALAGFAAVPGLPITGIQSYVGLGLGGELSASADVGHLFISASRPYKLRAVLSASGYYYGNKSSAVPATLLLFPVIFSAEFSYFLRPELRAIGRIGAGGTFDTLKINDSSATKTSDSSVAFSYQGDIGAGYRLGRTSSIELILLAGYMGEMQSLSASFLKVRVGVSWYF